MKKFRINLICSLSIRSDFYLLGLIKNNLPINKVIIIDNEKDKKKKKNILILFVVWKKKK